jgi:hypothetical protein
MLTAATRDMLMEKSSEQQALTDQWIRTGTWQKHVEPPREPLRPVNFTPINVPVNRQFLDSAFGPTTITGQLAFAEARDEDHDIADLTQEEEEEIISQADLDIPGAMEVPELRPEDGLPMARPTGPRVRHADNTNKATKSALRQFRR